MLVEFYRYRVIRSVFLTYLCGAYGTGITNTRPNGQGKEDLTNHCSGGSGIFNGPNVLPFMYDRGLGFHT
jgi:hypothetical protein